MNQLLILILFAVVAGIARTGPVLSGSLSIALALLFAGCAGSERAHGAAA